MTAFSSAMCEIRLSGSLARQFGRIHRRHLETGSTSEAFSALRNTLPGFRETIQKLDRLGMRFAIFRNRKNVGEDELELGGTREIRIVPVLNGSKRGGVMQVVVGAVLIAAVLMSGGTAAFGAGGMLGVMGSIGISMAIGGVIQLLSPQPEGIETSAAPENQPSHGFGSARNTTASGNPVPICYGERRWGGAIVSAGIYAEDRA